MAQLPEIGLQTYTVQEAQNAALRQLGSIFLDTAATSATLEGDRCIIAITALTDVSFADLESIYDKYDGTRNWANDQGTGYGGQGNTMAFTDEIPKGVTIYGRWSKVTVKTNNMICICYVG